MRWLAGMLLALSVTLAGWAPAAAQQPLGPEYTVDHVALVKDTSTGGTFLIVFFSKPWGQTPPPGSAMIVVHLDPGENPSTLRWSRDAEGSSFEAEAGNAVLSPSASIRNDGSTAWWVPFAEDASSLDVGLDVTAGDGTQTWQEHLDLADTTPWDPFDPSGPYPVYDLVKGRPLPSPVTSSTTAPTTSSSAAPEKTTKAPATSAVPETIAGPPPVTESVPEQTGGGLTLWLVGIAIALFLALVLALLVWTSLNPRRRPPIDDPSLDPDLDPDLDDTIPSPVGDDPLDSDDTIPGPIGDPGLDSDDTIGDDLDPELGPDDTIPDPIGDPDFKDFKAFRQALASLVDDDTIPGPVGDPDLDLGPDRDPDLDPDDIIHDPIGVDDLDPSSGSDDPTVRPDTRDLLAPDDPSAASDPPAATSPDPELEEFRREYPNARRSPDDPDAFEIDL